MKFTQGKIGRIFVIRLENGDKVPDCIEQFALQMGITHSQVVMIGGIGKGQVVSGPRYSDIMPPEAMLLPVDGAHEVLGLGILVPGPNNQPLLHMHAALGRAGQTLTGCLRPGVETWLVGEVIIFELVDVKAARVYNKDSGFSLLETET